MLQVVELQAAVGDLDALRQQHTTLKDLMAECERQAAINSELRLRAFHLQELQEEHEHLKQLVQWAEELRMLNKQMEQDALLTAALSDVKVNGGMIRCYRESHTCTAIGKHCQVQ